jgi:hypothetical protein
MRERSQPRVCAQGPKARWAAATASALSSAVSAGTAPTVLPSAGLATATVAPEMLSRHWPPM